MISTPQHQVFLVNNLDGEEEDCLPEAEAINQLPYQIDFLPDLAKVVMTPLSSPTRTAILHPNEILRSTAADGDNDSDGKSSTYIAAHVPQLFPFTSIFDCIGNLEAMDFLTTKQQPKIESQRQSLESYLVPAAGGRSCNLPELIVKAFVVDPTKYRYLQTPKDPAIKSQAGSSPPQPARRKSVHTQIIHSLDLRNPLHLLSLGYFMRDVCLNAQKRIKNGGDRKISLILVHEESGEQLQLTSVDLKCPCESTQWVSQIEGLLLGEGLRFTESLGTQWSQSLAYKWGFTSFQGPGSPQGGLTKLIVTDNQFSQFQSSEFQLY